GARLKLPSGQKVAEKLGFEVLHGAVLQKGPEAETLEKYGFLEDTPLWYYILKEAELLGKDRRLGPTGSKLIADVIMTALTADPDSYLSVTKDKETKWAPTLPGSEISTGPTDYSMSDLVNFVVHHTK